MYNGFPGGSVVRSHLPIQEMQGQSLSQENPLKKDMATLSSIFAWKIPWTEEPGGSVGVAKESSVS